MAEPVSWSADLAAKYGPTGVGLLIGTAARYGLTLSEGKTVVAKNVVADFLLLGFLGFIAIFGSDMVGRAVGIEVSVNVRIFAGALAAVTSERLARLVIANFLRRAESELARTLSASPATSAEIPAGSGEPATIAIRPPIADAPAARASSTIRSVFDTTTRQRPPEDQIELLRRLDVPSGE